MTRSASSGMSGSAVARGSVWELLGYGLPQAYVLVSSAAIARYLGPSGFGRLALILSVQAALITTFTWGVPFATIRYIGEFFGARRLAEVNGVTHWAYRMTAFGAAAAFAVMAGAGALGAHPAAAWYVAAIATPFAVMHSVPSSLLIGAQRWRDARIVGMTTGFFAMVAKVLLVVLGQGIVSLFLVDLAVAVCNVAGTTLLARRVQRPLPPATLDDETRRRVRSFALVASISVIVTLVVYQRTEVFLLARFATDADIAQYSVPYSLVAALVLFPTAAASVLNPAFATLHGSEEGERIRSGFGRSLRLMVMLTLLLTGITAAVGAQLIRIVYGPHFAHVETVLLVLAASLPFVPLATLSGSLLRGIGFLRELTLIGVASAVANVALAFALIPSFGTVGAAAANTLAQIGGSLPLVVYATRRVGGSLVDADWLVRLVLAILAATVLAALAASRLPAWAGLVVGSAVYAAVLLVVAARVHLLPRGDAVWVADLFGTRVRGLPAALARYAGGIERTRSAS